MANNLDFFRNDEPDTIARPDPLWSIKKDDEILLKWLKDSVEHREKLHKSFFETAKNNLSAYLGQYYTKTGRQSESLERLPMPKTTKYFVNYLYEMTETLVSKMTRMKPAVDIVPANDEFEDKNSAKIVDLLMKHLWYVNDLDFFIQKVHRHKYIFGEAYLMIDWDINKGDFLPEYIKLKKSGNSDKVSEGTSVKTGDVCYTMLLPWNMLLEDCDDFEKVSNSITKECLHIEEVKYKYPEAELKVPKEGAKTYDMDSGKSVNLAKHINVYTLHHKANEHFLQGRKIVFSMDEILEDGPLGYSHGDLPFIRITDIEAPGQLHGISRYQQALVLQNGHNNLSSSIMRNEFLQGTPKWMVPKGSVKAEQLANGNRAVFFQGPVAPQLVQMNPTSITTFNFRDKIEQEMASLMMVNQMSRGEPPHGVIAAVAMQFVAEQDNERASSDIAKHNQLVIELSKKSISVCGDYYRPDDGRMLRVLGKENKYLVKFFDQASLQKDYDVRIQIGSSTPNSKAAKIERVFQAMQYNAGLFDAERWAELLEFGSTEKMATLVSEAIVAAESEGEDLLEGHPVEEPKEWEDTIMHLRVHYKKIQARSFKEDVPLDRRSAFIQHIQITEMLAEEKAAKNPLFASKLAQLELFPMFWKSEVPQSSALQTAMAQGQIDNGQAVTGSMPATEPGGLPGQLPAQAPTV